jgi:MFS family permease
VLAFLDKARTIAQPSYTRWLMPPAALCVHLCIGQIYAFSVFNIPMTKLLGVTATAPPGGWNLSQLSTIPSAPGDWTLPELGWIFSVAIFVLGLSAALLGRWVEEGGPRKAMFTAALCFSSGFFISAVGVYVHNIWLICLGYGVIGGIGLGIGYISPVSTLVKWFPDRPGMATGMAIMGFGGASLIASPLSVWLMRHFSTQSHVGVAETFIALGAIYLCFMMVGAWTVRIPASGWQPEGFSQLATTRHVYVYKALKTPQFWLVWWILCLNVTAGIGVLGQASAMSQEMFPGRVTAVAAAGFVGLMGLFNMAGRFFWSSVSDFLGRKKTYLIFFALGAALYAFVPTTGALGSATLFVLSYALIFSMYGGAFATVPAYLRDLFGTRYVGAIHGMVLTAWSVAGIAGPALVNYMREYNVTHGVATAAAYNVTLYVMAALLVIGFICNCFVRPVHERFYMALDEGNAQA